jgi:hypothetical protein
MFQSPKVYGKTILTQNAASGLNSVLSSYLVFFLRQGHQLIVGLDADGQLDPNDIGHFMSGLWLTDIALGRRHKKPG